MARSSEATPAPPDRRARRRQELHERIFQTARGLFLEQGFEATTVEQIADAADIAPATFFNHFPSKEHVLREMAGEVIERFRLLVEQQRKRAVSTPERLVGFADQSARLVGRAPELTRRIVLAMLHSAEPDASGRQLGGLQAWVADLLADGQARGDVRAEPPADELAEIVVSVVSGAMTRWVADPSYPLRARLRASARFLGEALAPPSG